MRSANHLPLDIDRLEREFSYDPQTGVIARKSDGVVVGHQHHGRRGKPTAVRIRVGATEYLAHRIAWALVHRADPAGSIIDHINGNPFDNRLSNLRLATNQQNTFNSTGRGGQFPKGVTKLQGKFVARIFVDGEDIYLGRYETAEAAARAYDQVSRLLHREFYRGQE